MPDVLLLPECYADTALISMLAPLNVEIDHIAGVHNVVKEMRSAAENRPTYIVVEIVDKDVTYKPHRRPLYFDNFVLEEAGNKLTYGWKPNAGQYLILLDKAIESFLLWNAEEVQVDVVDYGFSTDVKAFGKVLKTSAIGTNLNYLQLLTDLRTRQAPSFLTLERILNDVIAA